MFFVCLCSYDLFDGRDHSQTPLITHARHRTHLESALRFLEAFLDTRKLIFLPCSLPHS
jgi:hypothetical protein